MRSRQSWRARANRKVPKSRPKGYPWRCGYEVFVAVRGCCEDEVEVKGIEIGNKARVGELAELLSEVRATC